MCEISSFHTSFYQLIQSLFGDILELLSDFEASFDLYFFIEYNPFRKEVNEFKDPEFGLDVVWDPEYSKDVEELLKKSI